MTKGKHSSASTGILATARAIATSYACRGIADSVVTRSLLRHHAGRVTTVEAARCHAIMATGLIAIALLAQDCRLYRLKQWKAIQGLIKRASAAVMQCLG